MRHKRLSRRLSRTTAHRKAMMRNLVTSLFLHDRLETTLAKAKELRPVAEKMITLAKRGDLHARRQAESFIRSHTVCGKLFEDGKSRYQDRPGGYIRITHTRVRRGDAAPMAMVELVNAPAKEK
ncbi:50S ribosomal protein L17 [Dethiosulfatarculus sandiegensis]|jgi:large subunit ribosomal protein L17|uniref:Large ribosomal subunit protein bL17 n=1 Tax=Dethiosulfatarculus sandiegensis TaxID=1429043 RepID=A0A0D2JK37_9BACT|nr:50S ribosomal protein L17 [Dethiosulfatarculus sandiegensis]KIX15981.1 50S ribosomal protein L17 [Dethiosulfatarculus sandiegensis]